MGFSKRMAGCIDALTPCVSMTGTWFGGGGVEKRMMMIMIQGEPSVVALGLTSLRAEL